MEGELKWVGGGGAVGDGYGMVGWMTRDGDMELLGSISPDVMHGFEDEMR